MTINGFEDLIIYTVTAIQAAFAWVVKRVYNRIDVMQSDISENKQRTNDIAILMAEKYVRKEEILHLEAVIREEFKAMGDKLDRKADK